MKPKVHASKTEVRAPNTRKNARGMRFGLPFRLLMGLVALLACWGVLPPDAYAQVRLDDEVVEWVEWVVSVPVMAEIGLADLSSTDLSGMSSKWWKNVSKTHTRMLGSSDEHVKRRALQNIIVFAKTYRDHVDLARAVPKLYKIYRSDENEEYRMLALSALISIGNRNVIALLREDVRVEKSERVRRHTLLALAGYYKNHGAQ